MKTPHKHADAIKAWADGAEIEYLDLGSVWKSVISPRGDEDGEDEWKEFAVAKKDFWVSNEQRAQSNNSLLFKTKPDVVKYGLAWKRVWDCKPMNGDNLKLTFDGETGKLKSAEVI